MNTEELTDRPTNPEELGAFVWWNLSGATCILDMDETLGGAGLTDDWNPPSPRAETIVKRAALAIAKNKRQLIRPLKTKGVWEFVTESADTDELIYTSNVRITIDKSADRASPQIEVVPQSESDVPLAEEIAAKFSVFRGLMTASDMSSWLLRVLSKKVDAVGFRDRGGFYFVPNGQPLDTWRKVCKVIHAVSEHTTCSMPVIRCADSISTILHALREESNSTMARLDEGLAGIISTRGLTAWDKALAALLAKIERYVDLFGVELPILTMRADNILTRLSDARLAHNAPDPLPEGVSEAAQ